MSVSFQFYCNIPPCHRLRCLTKSLDRDECGRLPRHKTDSKVRRIRRVCLYHAVCLTTRRDHSTPLRHSRRLKIGGSTDYCTQEASEDRLITSLLPCEHQARLSHSVSPFATVLHVVLGGLVVPSLPRWRVKCGSLEVRLSIGGFARVRSSQRTASSDDLLQAPLSPKSFSLRPCRR